MAIMVSIPLPFNENPFGINVDVEISVAKENINILSVYL